mgnify:CR=1 FL=1
MVQQLNNEFTTRFYKPNDPYYYEVDNLPLIDLLLNSETLRAKVNEIIVNTYTKTEIDDMLSQYTYDLNDINGTNNTGKQEGDILIWDENSSQYVSRKLEMTDLKRGYVSGTGANQEPNAGDVLQYDQTLDRFVWREPLTSQVFTTQELIVQSNLTQHTRNVNEVSMYGYVGAQGPVHPANPNGQIPTGQRLPLSHWLKDDGGNVIPTKGSITHVQMRVSIRNISGYYDSTHTPSNEPTFEMSDRDSWTTPSQAPFSSNGVVQFFSGHYSGEKNLTDTQWVAVDQSMFDQYYTSPRDFNQYNKTIWFYLPLGKYDQVTFELMAIRSIYPVSPLTGTGL